MLLNVSKELQADVNHPLATVEKGLESAEVAAILGCAQDNIWVGGQRFVIDTVRPDKRVVEREIHEGRYLNVQ